MDLLLVLAMKCCAIADLGPTLRSAIRRIHSSQRAAVLDAQRDGSVAVGRGKLRAPGTSNQLALEKTLLGQPLARGRRPDHASTVVILAGLLGGFGSGAVRRSRLCAVRLTRFMLLPNDLPVSKFH